MTRSYPLSPVVTLSSCPWADDPVLGDVFALFGDTPLWIVGGAVRNAVMGRAVTDWDLTTPLRPEAVMDLAGRAGVKAIPTGIDYGTVTLVVRGCGVEITTLRADVATDGRRAVVAYTDDIAVDAARRDLTMNALYADLAGHVYDPLGTGLHDARAGHVRFVGDATARIAEDTLRILRFFRFHAHYGAGAMDRDAVAACAGAAMKLTTLSRERITDEVLKWLSAEDPLPTLRTAYARGIMRYIIPAACDLDVLARVVAMQGQIAQALQICYPRESGDPSMKGPPPARGRHFQSLMRLLILLNGADPQPILRLAGKDARFIQTVETVVLEPVHDVAAAKRDIYRHGADVFWARLMIDIAEAGGDMIPRDILALRDWTVPKFPVKAADIMARKGLKPGPELGARLRELEEAWVENDFKD